MPYRDMIKQRSGWYYGADLSISSWMKSLGFPVKADPFGSDIESPLDRPEGDGGSTGPTRNIRVGNPIADVESVVEGIEEVLRSGGDLVRVTGSTFRRVGERNVPLADIAALYENQVEAGDRMYDRWQEYYADYVNEEVIPAWNAAQQSGADVMIPGLEGIVGEDVEFAGLGARFAEWSDQNAGILITSISESTRDAINGMVTQWGAFEPRDPRNVAQYIQPLIGVTPRSAVAIARQADKMLKNGDTHEAVLRYIGIENARRTKIRAELIARTELAYAYNFGMWHSVMEVADAGEFDENPVKVWFTQLDERVCPFCGPLHEAIVELGETYPGKTDRVRNTFAPPAHPRCRCVLLYEFKE